VTLYSKEHKEAHEDHITRSTLQKEQIENTTQIRRVKNLEVINGEENKSKRKIHISNIV